MSYHRRSSVSLPQSATLDERILGLHPPGAMYNSGVEYYNTVVEQRMRRVSSAIRARSGWIEALGDADTRAGWAKEAKEQGLTDLELCYVLDELAYYASLSQSGSNIRLSAVDGVWISDSLVDLETTDRLKDYAAILERVPSFQKDYWHPNPKNRVLNLIDPSLYPLVYSRSKLLRQPNFSWLPAEFSVDCNGAAEITSYINNLHPVKHAALYLVIASIFSKYLPLLEQVVTDLVHPRGDRPMDWPSCYYKSDVPKPLSIDNDDYHEAVEEWKKSAEFVYPQPKPFAALERPITPYTLHGRKLQAVVKMSNIELTPNSPRYRGDDWSVAAQANERIIATGVYYYDVSNISQCSLQLREPLSGFMFQVEQFDLQSVIKLYGINDPHNDGLLLTQMYGNVDIKDGLCVVYPSIYQHQMPEFKLANSSKPGHCKMLTFYFVDPATRVPSTAIVPPQQQEWWFEDALASEPFRNLPHLVLDGIANTVDFPISLGEAKRIRKEMAADLGKCNEEAAFETFEPHFFFSS
ncbi:hypothetical protein EV174_005054 [Coemansia sp. RSA 2320]|nr:hypothetical protein EV174_005054 [Coemansia sp. RSA 2320]